MNQKMTLYLYCRKANEYDQEIYYNQTWQTHQRHRVEETRHKTPGRQLK